MKNEQWERRGLVLEEVNRNVNKMLGENVGVKFAAASKTFEKFVDGHAIVTLERASKAELIQMVKQAVLMAVLIHEGIIK